LIGNWLQNYLPVGIYTYWYSVPSLTLYPAACLLSVYSTPHSFKFSNFCSCSFTFNWSPVYVTNASATCCCLLTDVVFFDIWGPPPPQRTASKLVKARQSLSKLAKACQSLSKLVKGCWCCRQVLTMSCVGNWYFREFWIFLLIDWIKSNDIWKC